MSPLFKGGGGAERDGGDRSGDERERARIEREARRSGRDGQDVQEPAPLPSAEPVSSPPPGTSVPPEEITAPGSVQLPPPGAPEPAAFADHEPDPEPAAFVDREPELEPAAFADHDHESAQTARQPPAYELEPVSADEPTVIVHRRSDAPAGIRRVPASAMASAAGADRPPRFGAPPRGTPRKRRGVRGIVALSLMLLIAAAALFLFRLYQPGKGEGTGRVALKVPSGANASQIGELLARKNVVASSFFFGLRARLEDKRSQLRSGNYTLRRDMSYGAALTALTKAPAAAPPKLATLTIPEGPSRREIVSLVKQAKLKGSYLTATKRSKVLDPRDFGAPKNATLEGFLFPATYDIKKNATAKSLVSQQLRAFRRAFAKVDMRAAKRKNLSRFDVLTVASMVEREAGVERDRRLIAGVVYNRLKQGIPLGIDATTRFELGNFSSPLKQSELQRDTPYNTRTRTGLPPGPIGNPGLASIRAAAKPASNSFLFYVVKPCGKGAHSFSSTDARFQRDVAAYNAKRAQLGGKDPSRC